MQIPNYFLKTWKNMRLSAKSKAVHYFKMFRRTGNVKPKFSLNDFEERISKIFGKYGTGLPIIEEAGISVPAEIAK